MIAWFSSLYTLNHLTFKQVTTTQLAAAMRKDEFWSDYRFDTLLFDGEVKGVVTQGGKTTVSLKTSDSYSLSCEITDSRSIKTGSTYEFEAETYQAQRESQGVLLHHCVKL